MIFRNVLIVFSWKGVMIILVILITIFHNAKPDRIKNWYLNRC